MRKLKNLIRVNTFDFGSASLTQGKTWEMLTCTQVHISSGYGAGSHSHSYRGIGWRVGIMSLKIQQVTFSESGGGSHARNWQCAFNVVSFGN